MFGRALLHLAMFFMLTAAAMAQTDASPKRDAHPEMGARIFAPYVFLAEVRSDLPTLHASSGIRHFTLAFVNSLQGCTPAWPGARPVASDTAIVEEVRKLRGAGGDVIVAFGGYEETELAQACSDTSSLLAAYQAVVNKYKAKILDFDIEHLAIEDQTSIDRRNLVLKNLALKNPGIQINFTLPATPTGLTAQAMTVLKSAVAQGTPVHTVNLMTMDYGAAAPSKDMGANAISAAEGAQIQLKELGLDAKLGITPMLGVNDTAGEIFTLADASTVLAYAQKNPKIDLLAYWSVGRDNGSCGAGVSPTCSGIKQQTWQFAHLLAAFH